MSLKIRKGRTCGLWLANGAIADTLGQREPKTCELQLSTASSKVHFCIISGCLQKNKSFSNKKMKYAPLMTLVSPEFFRNLFLMIPQEPGREMSIGIFPLEDTVPPFPDPMPERPGGFHGIRPGLDQISVLKREGTISFYQSLGENLYAVIGFLPK